VIWHEKGHHATRGYGTSGLANQRAGTKHLTQAPLGSSRGSSAAVISRGCAGWSVEPLESRSEALLSPMLMRDSVMLFFIILMMMCVSGSAESSLDSSVAIRFVQFSSSSWDV
jgi:hypothetical protein